MKQTAVRLWVLNLFLLASIILQRLFEPSYPVLLIPMGFLTLGVVIYALWAIWCIWKPKLDLIRQKL